MLVSRKFEVNLSSYCKLLNKNETANALNTAPQTPNSCQVSWIVVWWNIRPAFLILLSEFELTANHFTFYYKKNNTERHYMFNLSEDYPGELTDNLFARAESPLPLSVCGAPSWKPTWSSQQFRVRIQSVDRVGPQRNWHVQNPVKKSIWLNTPLSTKYENCFSGQKICITIQNGQHSHPPPCQNGKTTKIVVKRQ